MIRKFECLGIAVLAVLAMGVATASAAEFNVEAAPTTLTGAQEGTNTIVTDSGTIHCKAATFEGTVSTTSAAEITLTPQYKECTLTGSTEAAVTVHVNGCKWTYEATETSTAGVRLSGCAEGTSGILFTAPSCTITVLSQFTTMGPVHYLNSGSGSTRELKIESTIENLTYTELGSNCKNKGAHTTGGKLTGKITLTGENAETKAHRGVWFTPSTPQLHVESAPATLRGGQEGFNTTTIDSGTWHCSTITYTGSVSAKTSVDATFTPNMLGCRSTGFSEAEQIIDTNGCEYTLTFDSGTMDIAGCNAGTPGIVMTFPFCTVTIKEQTLGSVDFSNSGAGTTREISWTWTVSNFAYTEKGLGCKNSEASTTGG